MSGSGKTTLLNTIIGHLYPEQGYVKYCPPYMLDESKPEYNNIIDNLNEVKKTFGFAPQTPSFYPKLTVKENLYLFGSFYDIDNTILKRNINHLLKLTKLERFKDKLASELSGGMQRRLNIICGMIHKPYLLLLDEPTADLDPILREETWELIKEINRMGTTVIVASHLLEELEEYCTSIAILHNGHIAKSGPLVKIKKLYAKGNNEIRIVTETPKAIMKYIGKSKIIKKIEYDDEVKIFTPKPYKILNKLSKLKKDKKDKIRSIELKKISLREIFQELEG